MNLFWILGDKNLNYYVNWFFCPPLYISPLDIPVQYWVAANANVTFPTAVAASARNLAMVSAVVYSYSIIVIR